MEFVIHVNKRGTISIMDYNEKISLLWPDGCTALNTNIRINHNDSTFDDLGLEYIVKALSINSVYAVTVESILPFFL